MKKMLLLLAAGILASTHLFGQVSVTGCTGSGNGSYSTLGAAFAAIGTSQTGAAVVITITETQVKEQLL